MKKAPILSEEALKILVADIPAEEAPTEEASEVETEVEASEPSELEVMKAEFESFKLETDLKVADLEAAAEALKLEKEEIEATALEMKEIVTGQISRMRVALRLGAIDFKETKAADVVKEFKSISTQFMKALPVGSVVPEDNEAPTKKETAIPDSIAAGQYKSLGF